MNARKAEVTAQIIAATVVVRIDIRQLIEEQLYLKLPDASDITIDRVDWDETIEWLDNDLSAVPVAVEVKVSE